MESPDNFNYLSQLINWDFPLIEMLHRNSGMALNFAELCNFLEALLNELIFFKHHLNMPVNVLFFKRASPCGVPTLRPRGWGHPVCNWSSHTPILHAVAQLYSLWQWCGVLVAEIHFGRLHFHIDETYVQGCTRVMLCMDIYEYLVESRVSVQITWKLLLLLQINELLLCFNFGRGNMLSSSMPPEVLSVCAMSTHKCVLKAV